MVLLTFCSYDAPHETQVPFPARRRPKQRRARETLEAILDAVTKILKREGSQALTTNRIADVAGVSIGSLYQYFPDKRAIFIALQRPSYRTDGSLG